MAVLIFGTFHALAHTGFGIADGRYDHPKQPAPARGMLGPLFIGCPWGGELHPVVMDKFARRLQFRVKEGEGGADLATSGRGSGVVGYNVQVAVDTVNHLIVTHEVTNTGSDRSQLANVAREAKAVLQVD